MPRTTFIARSLTAICVATLLAACSNFGSSTGSVPTAAVGSALPGSLGIHPPVMPKKGQGAWGLSVDDGAAVEGGSNPVACSGPPSACNAYVEKQILRDALSTSSGFGAAWAKSTTALGSLTGFAKAESSGKGTSSAIGDVNIGWEDTFTITSKTLPKGTPVSLTATLKVTGPAFVCTATGYASLGVSSINTGLSYDEYCSSSPPPVLTATVNGTVGASFTDGIGMYLYAQAGTSYNGGKIAAGSFKAIYRLDPVTTGVSYKTASGKSYL